MTVDAVVPFVPIVGTRNRVAVWGTLGRAVTERASYVRDSYSPAPSKLFEEKDKLIAFTSRTYSNPSFY